MLLKPDPRLVVEQAALPAYTSEDRSADEPRPTALSGCLRMLWDLLLRLLARLWGKASSSGTAGGVQIPEERVQVILPPPAVTYKFVSFLDDTEHDQAVIRTSREGLAAYRAAYDEPSGWAHPLRIRKAHHSGLPGFLTGLVEADDSAAILDDPEAVATEWLHGGDAVRSKALFGITPAELETRLRYVGASRVGKAQDQKQRLETPLPGEQNTTTVHARFQQWHQQRWPVLGGQVVVHMAGADPRMSVTSSYFPLSPDTDFTPQIASSQAIELARQALAGYLEGPDAIGLLGDLLRPLLSASAMDETPETVINWGPQHDRIADKLLLALGAFSKQSDPDLAARIESGMSARRDVRLALLRDLWNQRDQYDLPPWPQWQANVTRYAGSEQFVFPFAGRYHLAYQIEFLSSARDDGWRVFLDAEDGTVLGRPERLVAHDRSYYANAADLLNHPPKPSLIPAEVTPLAPNIQSFMTLKFHADKGGGDVPLSQIERKSAAATTQVEREAVNVAYHAWTIYRHFIDVCGVQETTLHSYVYTDDGGNEVTQSPPLEVIVGKGGTNLAMGFHYAVTQHPKVVTFQTDALGGQGLAAEGPHRVHTPSLDPEVIYHEMSHGLMWLLNRAPSDLPNTSVPFGRALLEGYANYFARSLAAREDTASHLWARAAYRQADWADEWSLSRTTHEPGEDVLPAPNLYPETDTAGLPVYDVGMVWARAVWDIRDLLSQELGPTVGPDLADRLALNAFNHVHGWVANFEIAAEGLIASARALLTDNPQVEAIIDIFAQRRILAEKGVQALCQADDGQGGTVWVVGTDAGLKYSSDGGGTWSAWVRPQGEVGSAARGVVALASQDSTVYAVTEMGVHQWDSSQPNSAWSPLGQFPVTETPLSVLVSSGNLYVGTAHGVWRYDEPSDNWTSWNPSTQPFAGVALDVAGMSLAGVGQEHPVCLVAALKDVVFSEQLAIPAWGNLGRVQIAPNGQTAWFTAIAAVGDTVYAGTLSRGVFSQVMSYDPDWGPMPTTMPTSWSSLSAGVLGNAAVLCLAADGDHRLLAGTTSGLFEMDPTGGAGWARVVGLPAGAIVTSVLPAGDRLLVGTAAHGLWIRRSANGGTTWDNFPDIGT